MEIEKLTPLQYSILNEMSDLLSKLGAKSDILGVTGSYGDTLPSEDILQMLKGINQNIVVMSPAIYTYIDK